MNFIRIFVLIKIEIKQKMFTLNMIVDRIGRANEKYAPGFSCLSAK